MVDKITLLIFLAIFAGSALTDLSPIVFVILAGVAGIVLKNKEAQKK